MFVEDITYNFLCTTNNEVKLSKMNVDMSMLAVVLSYLAEEFGDKRKV